MITLFGKNYKSSFELTTRLSFVILSVIYTKLYKMSESLVRYDMTLYKDRWMHFYRTTSPRNLFVTDKELQAA